AAGRFPWGAAAYSWPLLLGLLAVGLPGVLRAAERADAPRAAAALLVAALALLGAEADVAGNADTPMLLLACLGAAVSLAPRASDAARRSRGPRLLPGAGWGKVGGPPRAAPAAGLFAARESGAARRIRTAALLLAPTAASLGIWFLFGVSRR